MNKEQLIKLAEKLYPEAFDANACFPIIKQGKMTEHNKHALKMSIMIFDNWYPHLRIAVTF